MRWEKGGECWRKGRKKSKVKRGEKKQGGQKPSMFSTEKRGGLGQALWPYAIFENFKNPWDSSSGNCHL